ncbi:aKG-HExxH-type peptide beta-hydroxylase [Paractinoplanes toevensis]|uniref:HEXXH motif domain-containing protein n=1 Tax=Paractinoplanes toevensis TaxID=571911 RepID=A0A919VYS2_9ACTN|nr:HEXXH motif-containing putative peptide modification protein [Actinoplanes toevensis]GIM89342.1 hypothetical protein Ato02nite_011350 [Actinoplanes toevensis]
MKSFRLTDRAFAELAAGRPSADTVGVLRRAQASRHLLLLGEIRRLGGPIPEPIERYDPMAALHTSVTLAALRAGTAPPPPRVAARHDLSITHAGLTLRVRLEDTDPLRSRLGLTPSRQLTPDQVATWRELLTAGWRLLTTRHRPAAEILAAVLSVIVPVEADPGSGGLSATSAHAFGAVAISTPGDPRAFAVGLLHECQHSLLNATNTLFDLVDPGGPRVCSPWREDPRPLAGLLHGAYAYQSVTRFWRTEAAVRIPAQRQGRTALTPRSAPTDNSLAHLPVAEPPALHEAGPRGTATGSAGPAGLGGRLAEFEFARWRAAVAGAAETLLASGHLTLAGERFVQVMHDEVGGWQGDAVDSRVARLADGANAEHRARWRLRNLAVPDDVVAELVAAWRRGEPAPAVPEAQLRRYDGRRLENSVRLALVHRLLRDGDHPGRAGSGLRPGDDAYLDGEAGTAYAAYVEDLGVGPGDLDRWAGLAVVAPHRALYEQPELVRAVWLSADEAGLDTVTEWLSRSLMPSRA